MQDQPGHAFGRNVTGMSGQPCANGHSASPHRQNATWSPFWQPSDQTHENPGFSTSATRSQPGRPPLSPVRSARQTHGGSSFGSDSFNNFPHIRSHGSNVSLNSPQASYHGAHSHALSNGNFRYSMTPVKDISYTVPNISIIQSSDQLPMLIL